MSAFQSVALNVGEALLHPRAPPLTIDFQKDSSKEQKHNGYHGPDSKAVAGTTGVDDAMDWDGSEQDDSADEGAEDVDRPNEESTELEASTVVDDELDENYDDARPQGPIDEPMEVDMQEAAIEEEECEEDEEKDKSAECGRACADVEKAFTATNEADDDDDDDFPDIVVGDD